ALAAGEDKANADEIKIQLKDFKFKPPVSVTDPDSVFVFNEDDQKLCFYTNGPAEAKVNVPTAGEWDVIVSASGDSAMNVPGHGAGKTETTVRPNFQLGIDAKDFGKEVTLKSDDMQDYKVLVPLTAGEHVISVTFTNDMYDPDGKYDSNLYVHGVKLKPHKADEPKAEAGK
ncbi:MAG TPA: carbohydrate-binding domain-containing protein, partial [Pirellulales bacterium]